eukprot:4266559-Alexandrium_andersonii.AAC.1
MPNDSMNRSQLASLSYSHGGLQRSADVRGDFWLSRVPNSAEGSMGIRSSSEIPTGCGEASEGTGR